MNITSKVAIVTGASSGIGRAFAEQLAAKGAQVYGFARGLEGLNETASKIGDAFHAVQCDVREEDAVRRAFAEVLDDAGRIDILINNAGLGKFDRVEDLSLEDWNVQIETNLRGVFLCAREAIPTMRRQNEAAGFGGHIINIASIAGLLGNPTLGGYNASKFGVRGFSEALMKEVREDGIKVSCVYPGSIETNFSMSSSATTNKMTPYDIASTVMHLIETDDNYLISEVVMRPLRPKG